MSDESMQQTFDPALALDWVRDAVCVCGHGRDDHGLRDDDELGSCSVGHGEFADPPCPCETFTAVEFAVVLRPDDQIHHPKVSSVEAASTKLKSARIRTDHRSVLAQIDEMTRRLRADTRRLARAIRLLQKRRGAGRMEKH